MKGLSNSSSTVVDSLWVSMSISSPEVDSTLGLVWYCSSGGSRRTSFGFCEPVGG